MDRARGRPRAGKTKKVDIRISPEVADAIRIRAGDRHGGTTEWVTRAIEVALGRVDVDSSLEERARKRAIDDAIAAIRALMDAPEKKEES